MIYFRLVLERVAHLFQAEYLDKRNVGASNDKIKEVQNLIQSLETIAGLSDESEAFKQISAIIQHNIETSKAKRANKPAGKYERFLDRAAIVIEDALKLSSQFQLQHISKEDLDKKEPVTLLRLALAQYLTDRCYDRKHLETPALTLFNIDKIQGLNTAINFASTVTTQAFNLTSSATALGLNMTSKVVQYFKPQASTVVDPLIISNTDKSTTGNTDPTPQQIATANHLAAEAKAAQEKIQSEQAALLIKKNRENKEQSEKQRLSAECEAMFPKGFPQNMSIYNEELDVTIATHLTLLPSMLGIMNLGKPAEKAQAHHTFNLILADVQLRLPIYINRVIQYINNGRKSAESDMTIYIIAAHNIANSTTLGAKAQALSGDAEATRQKTLFFNQSPISTNSSAPKPNSPLTFDLTGGSTTKSQPQATNTSNNQSNNNNSMHSTSSLLTKKGANY